MKISGFDDSVFCSMIGERILFNDFFMLRQTYPTNWQSEYGNESSATSGVNILAGNIGFGERCDSYHMKSFASTLQYARKQTNAMIEGRNSISRSLRRWQLPFIPRSKPSKSFETDVSHCHFLTPNVTVLGCKSLTWGTSPCRR